MRLLRLLALVPPVLLAGCGFGLPNASQAGATITSVTPSATGIPLSIASLGTFEFVSVQKTGEIFTYNIAGGSQALVGKPYATPCADPSGMAVSSLPPGGILAVACYDTGQLLTLTIHADGSLSALGSVSGLPSPYPGIALDGTTVYVPLFGISQAANGAVAAVDISVPAAPRILKVTPLASPVTGGFANPGALTVADGHIFVAAGSESAPINASSTIQVLDQATLSLVGTPFVVDHSPQQLAVKDGIAYVTFFDATELQSIDISNPARLVTRQVLPLTQIPGCHALPIAVRDTAAYLGCYYEAVLERFDITDPANMQLTQFRARVDHPQHLRFAGRYLLASSSVNGGSVTQIDVGPTN